MMQATELVTAALQRFPGHPLNFRELQSASGLGKQDLLDAVKTMKDGDALAEEDGRFSLMGDLAVQGNGGEPEPDAVEGFLADADAEEEPPELAQEEPLAEAPSQQPQTARLPEPVRLTFGMAGAMSPETLGDLIRAGVNEAHKAGRPFVLVIE